MERKRIAGVHLYVGVVESPDPDDDLGRDVPALFMEHVEEPLWVAPADTYWDEWGDGRGYSAEEVVADHLRKILGGTT